MPHWYYTLPEAPEDIEGVFDRFVTAGKGRIDHVSGYLDGFGVFEDLSESDVDGLIHGDERFGWRPVGSPAVVRVTKGSRNDSYAGRTSRWPPGAMTVSHPPDPGCARRADRAEDPVR